MDDDLAKDLIPFVLTEDPVEIAAFAGKLRITQGEAVDELIEHTCWGGEDLPDLVGGNGSAAERLGRLRAVLERDLWVFDQSLLTPLEFEMFQVMGHVVAFIDRGDAD